MAAPDSDYLREWLHAIQNSIVLMFGKREFTIDDCKAAFETMRNSYGDPRAGTEPPTFDQEVFRWAYMFSYIMRHAHLVYEALHSAHDGGITWMNDEGTTTNVCAFGGGPGTDILGIEMFTAERGYLSPKGYHVFDEFPQWEPSWDDLRAGLGKGFVPDNSVVQYGKFHAGIAGITEIPADIIGDADLITMVKFLSSTANDATVRNTVRAILMAMKPGACLLYVDNQSGPSLGILLESARDLRFSLKGRALGIALDMNMLSVDFSHLCQCFGPYFPLLSGGSNEYVILRKSEWRPVDDLYRSPMLPLRFRCGRKPWDTCYKCGEEGHWGQDHV